MTLFDKVSIQASTESIKQQSTIFFKELTAIFADFNGASRTRIHDGEFTKRMKACVKHHLGLEPEIDLGHPKHKYLDSGYSATVIPPTLSRYLMSKKEAEEFTEEIVKINFNLSTGKITGNVKRVLAYLSFDTELIVRKTLTPEEHAALTLHEIGHLFFVLYYSSRLATTNMALNMIAKDFDKANTQKERVMLYKQYLGPITGGWINLEIEEVEDMKTLVSYVFRSMQKTIQDELGNPQYGQTMDEYLADMYATRHGAGVALITALEKISSGYDTYVTASRFISYMRIIITAIFGVGAALVGQLGAVVTAMIVIMLKIWATFIPSELEYRYDNTVDRVKRVRNQIQLRMRLMTDNKKKLAMFKQELEELDNILSTLNNKSSSFSSWLTLLVSPNARNRRKQAELEMFYEDLAYNKLHEEALTLKYA